MEPTMPELADRAVNVRTPVAALGVAISHVWSIPFGDQLGAAEVLEANYTEAAALVRVLDRMGWEIVPKPIPSRPHSQ